MEAYPEDDMAHLSAKSGLYARIFTEGLFGIIPTELNRFECTLHLPKSWDKMSLRKIKAFGQDFDLSVSRTKSGKLKIEVFDNEREQVVMRAKYKEGEKVVVEF